jgi:cytochrome o ubiquinol oxidase operon protein cyoD
MAGFERDSTMGEIRSYITGFVLSILLTLMPFLMVYYKTVQGTALIITIIVFALLQLFVQLIFFLHLGKGNDRQWNIMAFLFMIMVVLIVVIGSLWIMNNLDYRMTGHDAEQHLLKEEGIRQ